MIKTLKKIYDFFETLPDRLYPFASKIEGKFVRGRKSYLYTVKKAFDLNGPGKFGFRLMFYRELFHFIGAVLFIVFITLIAREFYSSEITFFFLLVAAILALSFQEFYFHPKKYKQFKLKGVIDWLVWVVPMFIYLTYFS